MNEYKDLLDQLNMTLLRIGEYEDQIKDLQSLIEQKTNQSSNLFDEQLIKINDMKSRINGYIDDYNLMFESTTKSLSEKLDSAAQSNIKKVKSELTLEILDRLYLVGQI